MMIKLFGVLDLIAALLLLLVFYHLIIPMWLILAGGYLVLKGWVFLILGRDIASIADLTIGLFLLLFAFIEMPSVIMIIFLVWILQKALFSFI